MGVDYYTCDKCRENFPDCAPYQTCEEPACHHLCERCMVLEAEAGDDGYIPRSSCPVCQAKGTPAESMADSMERIRKLMGLSNDATTYAIGEAVADLKFRMDGLCK